MSKRSIVAALAVLGVLVAATPAQAVVRASGELRRVSTTRYELVVRNTGDESFNGITFTAVRGIDLQASPPECNGAFWGPDGNGIHCDGFTPALEPGRTRTFTFLVTNGAYPTGAGGTLDVRQTGPPQGRGGPFPVTGPPAAGEPVIGRSELVSPVRGVVLVRRRGNDRFVRLRRGRLLPDGSEIDTRRGTIRVTVASDQAGGLSTATVSEGRAIIDQNRAARPTTTLRLSEPLACAGRVATASLARAKRRKQREIFVRTKGGRFKTRGNHAAGTASGTAWRTSDTCSSTTIKVVEGTVRVRDLRRRRTVNVTAPDSYTARRRSAVAPGRTVQRASTTGSVERATKLLEGKRLPVYIDSRVTDSDVEHSGHLASRARVRGARSSSPPSTG